MAKDPAADASRVIQGVITGIGFLGAGVILHGPTGIQVQGLTTAATMGDGNDRRVVWWVLQPGTSWLWRLSSP
jgi:hypothetical protein